MKDTKAVRWPWMTLVSWIPLWMEVKGTWVMVSAQQYNVKHCCSIRPIFSTPCSLELICLTRARARVNFESLKSELSYSSFLLSLRRRSCSWSSSKRASRLLWQHDQTAPFAQDTFLFLTDRPRVSCQEQPGWTTAAAVLIYFSCPSCPWFSALLQPFRAVEFFTFSKLVNNRLLTEYYLHVKSLLNTRAAVADFIKHDLLYIKTYIPKITFTFKVLTP